MSFVNLVAPLLLLALLANGAYAGSAPSNQIFEASPIPWDQAAPAVLNFTTVPAYPNQKVVIDLQYVCCNDGRPYKPSNIKVNTDANGVFSIELDDAFNLHTYFYIVLAKFPNVTGNPKFAKWFDQP